MSDGIIQNIWRSRVILLSGFGLVGIGAAIGATSVYYLYLKHKLQDVFQIQASLSSQVVTLKKQVDNVSKTLSQISIGNGGVVGSEQSNGDTSSRRPSRSSIKRTVRFKGGYETADEDEYITASSDSDGESVRENIAEYCLLDIPTGSLAEAWIVEFLLDIDKLLDGDGFSQHEGYIRLQSYKDKLQDFCGFWWRFAKATHMEATAAGQSGDSEMKKSLTLAAFTRAERSLHLNDSSPNAHKWYAITLGNKGDYLPISEKIKNGFTFKEHVDRAVKLNPKDSSLHYLLGRFCFEVANLGWVERKVASTLFSSPPSSTSQEALEHFQAAERLGKPLKDNRLYMAKSYIALKNNELAAHWLKLTVEMPNVSSSDKPIHDEATQLYSKYRKYLK